MPAPGTLNTICDVPGLTVGNTEDHDLTTGVTVIIPDQPAVAAVDHRGGATGSRDTVLLGLGAVVEEIHAITLSGGSAYGLDAAGGVMHAMRKERRGFQIGSEVVPLVPSAIIFDLLCGGPKTWDHPVWWELGRKAYAARGREIAQGNAGAGMGATAGPLKGGLGTVSLVDDAWAVGALSIANPVGEVTIPGTDTLWAWMFERDGELGGQTPPTTPLADAPPPEGQTLANTTLSVVATDAALTKDQAKRIAIMAQDGMAHAIRPVHGPYDGDTVFMLSTGRREVSLAPSDITRLGTQAAECVARSIARGVYEAQAIAGYPAYRDRQSG